MRLTKVYFLQSIYYPGFTIGGGIGEFGGNCSPHPVVLYTFGRCRILADAGLGSSGLAVYWLLTHPVNQFWLEVKILAALVLAFLIRSESV